MQIHESCWLSIIAYESWQQESPLKGATGKTSIKNLYLVQKFKEKQAFQKKYVVVIRTDCYMVWFLMKENLGKATESDSASNFI